ncbi:hypothetical protein M2263_001196 [Providencia alcalifaciens]|nr:hypothetical protein [Providencia alcalifaciens]
MKNIAYLLFYFTLQGCSSIDHTEQTAECMEYRAMLTAPMPQHAQNELQKKCENSMKRGD